MKTEYHDPTLVEAIGRAIVRSAAECIAYAVVVENGGETRVFPHASDIRDDDHRWVFNGYVCEERDKGRAVRRCIMSPLAFSCGWVDA